MGASSAGIPPPALFNPGSEFSLGAVWETSQTGVKGNRGSAKAAEAEVDQRSMRSSQPRPCAPHRSPTALPDPMGFENTPRVIRQKTSPLPPLNLCASSVLSVTKNQSPHASRPPSLRPWRLRVVALNLKLSASPFISRPWPTSRRRPPQGTHRRRLVHARQQNRLQTRAAEAITHSMFLSQSFSPSAP